MQLITFKERYFAQTFSDYMKSQGIHVRIEQDQQGYFQLFLDDSQHLSKVETELALFIQNPHDKRYSEATWQAGNASVITSASKFNTNKIIPQFITSGPITCGITVMTIFVYILLFFFGNMTVLGWLGYPVIADYYPQVWRFITPILLHFSMLHIIFNLTWWWYLGGMIEKRRGKFKLIEITLLAGLLSNYAEAVITGPYFGGLSGVVYALMGYVWLYGELVKDSGLKLDRVMITVAVIWLIAGYTGTLGPIANTAHLVGLIVGLLLAFKDSLLKKRG